MSLGCSRQVLVIAGRNESTNQGLELRSHEHLLKVHFVDLELSLEDAGRQDSTPQNVLRADGVRSEVNDPHTAGSGQ